VIIRQTLKFLFLLPTVALVLNGCVVHPTSYSTTPSSTALADLGYVNMNSLPNGNGAINPVRLQALRETATTLGARGALAWRSEHINAALTEEASNLDHVFDFNQLLLKHNVLPPVIAESRADLNLANNDTIRTADKSYQIVSPARFVTTPPTWRNYLWLSFDKPDSPDTTLLPKDKIEAQVWDFYLKKGWQDGLQQANDIFVANLSRLKRDFTGMILYRKLLAQGMISSPIVAKADLGVTGNANEIRVNDEIMRITAHAALQPNSRRWKPVLTDGNLNP
jgi:defect-in-organelle-trafficking protein DotC